MNNTTRRTDRMAVVNGVDDEVKLSEAPMADEDIKQRLIALHELDDKIIELLETASSAIKALEAGKKAATSNSDSMTLTAEARSQFKDSTEKYYELLELVSTGLRKEIRTLHLMSKEKVLPVSLAPKAQLAGQQKEEALWKRIDELLQREDASKQDQS
ncbi:mediator of RNA polymerase II transcription subunit 11 [Trichomonascus vanleenenianus]|uniref:Med11p n=1 Tax=Trichomonascus vanleenenianus TaxID=2268995 RepID=UPI003ECB7DD7